MKDDRSEFFFDTEFIENGSTIIPLSIGIVSEDGRELYLEWHRTPEELATANEFVQTNVFPHLAYMNEDYRFVHEAHHIRELLVEFVTGVKFPRLWAWYATYDWMVLCQMFGNMTDLPEHFLYFPMDLRAIVEWEGGQKRYAFPKQQGTAHNALEDAKHLKVMYDIVKGSKA
jgi:3'-5' exoribonuclease-like protein